MVEMLFSYIVGDRSLDRIVGAGRSTEGPALANDREVSFLPEGVALPTGD